MYEISSAAKMFLAAIIRLAQFKSFTLKIELKENSEVNIELRRIIMEKNDHQLTLSHKTSLVYKQNFAMMTIYKHQKNCEIKVARYACLCLHKRVFNYFLYIWGRFFCSSSCFLLQFRLIWIS